MKTLQKIRISGAEVFPIVEGGKGVGVSNGLTAGAFAAADAVGTFSGTYPNLSCEALDEPSVRRSEKTRQNRSKQLANDAIRESIAQARIAHEISGGRGRIHMNILWGLAKAEMMVDGILSGAKGMIHGITCGAGMPYKLAELAEKYKTYFYPIVSSMRAFSILWTRSYSKVSQLLGGVVYEDPWLAGGHNGLSNKENPLIPEDPYPRVATLREFMNKVGLRATPIVMAGGVWNLKEYAHWIDNPEIGPVAFQLGTRPLLTKESPISDEWKKKLRTLKREDILLNKFSPTSFYSSAINNAFLCELYDRSTRQVEYKEAPDAHFCEPLTSTGSTVYVEPDDWARAEAWKEQGFNAAIKTPDSTLLFLTKERARQIQKDQSDCSGCLAGCRFSGWMDSEEHRYVTGLRPDPRSYCILKTLQKVIQGINVEHELMFSGAIGYRFAEDPYYANGHIPSIKELVRQLLSGE
ncbi:MAG: nitronate monooxygenase [Ignavibacteriales bacterium]|nr:nitronate monooxygenase [Ignavibacteriales bacterium]